MQRKATKNTRAENADEKRFKHWVKNQPCIECGDEPVIVDHMYGSTMRHNKVLIGMWALLPLCLECDRVKTMGSHNAYREAFGRTQAEAWEALVVNSDWWEPAIPRDVFNAIMDWNR